MLLRLFPPSEEPKFTWLEFTYPSTLNLSPLLHSLLEPLTGKDSFEKIELGLQEALVNAVVHGNENNPRKLLRIRRIITPKWMVWQVQDQGIGISSDQKISSLPKELDSNNGRGLFLINKCFDDVRWSPKGNRVQLACKN